MIYSLSTPSPPLGLRQAEYPSTPCLANSVKANKQLQQTRVPEVANRSWPRSKASETPLRTTKKLGRSEDACLRAPGCIALSRRNVVDDMCMGVVERGVYHGL